MGWLLSWFERQDMRILGNTGWTAASTTRFGVLSADHYDGVDFMLLLRACGSCLFLTCCAPFIPLRTCVSRGTVSRSSCHITPEKHARHRSALCTPNTRWSASFICSDNVKRRVACYSSTARAPSLPNKRGGGSRVHARTGLWTRYLGRWFLSSAINLSPVFC